MRKLHLWAFALTALAALSLVAAACGDDDSSGGASTNTPSSSSGSPGASGTSGSSAASGLDALKKAATDLAKTTYKLTYEIKGNDPKTGALDGTFTLISKPPRSVFAVTSSDGNIVVIDDGTYSYLCIDAEGQKNCLKSKSEGGSSAMPLPTLFNVDDIVKNISDDASTTVKDAKSRKIAGRDGKCYEVTSKEGTGTLCIDPKDGIVLLIDGTFSGSRMTLTAKEYSSTPADKDFEPPYPVTDISN
jgi:hypothetical protein